MVVKDACMRQIRVGCNVTYYALGCCSKSVNYNGIAALKE